MAKRRARLVTGSVPPSAGKVNIKPAGGDTEAFGVLAKRAAKKKRQAARTAERLAS